MKLTNPIKWNTKIDCIVMSLGGKRAKQTGFYSIKGKTVDLTASGDTALAVAQNILRQI